ncbi:transposase [Polyangium jinanense]|uniref:Transposase n=1 Tax=Polyangium jinanense TaxID=2829994 RepID=A0A9X3X6U4_9BACT|nr:transposase [Polyangium jinanense]MDC3983845.1 transposase [Polyangium jinanense]
MVAGEITSAPAGHLSRLGARHRALRRRVPCLPRSPRDHAARARRRRARHALRDAGRRGDPPRARAVAGAWGADDGRGLGALREGGCGFDIHAGAVIDGRDRRRVERLCRYLARPPIA